jgi:hypothetical protein
LQQISGLFRTQVIPAVVGISHGGMASLESPERKNYNKFRGFETALSLIFYNKNRSFRPLATTKIGL